MKNKTLKLFCLPGNFLNRKYLLVLIQVSLISSVYAQHQNSIPNGGFEIGTYQGCENGDFAVQNWEITTPGCGYGSNPEPKWINLNNTTCYNYAFTEYSQGYQPLPFPSNKFLWLKTEDSQSSCSQDKVAVVFVGLEEDLDYSTDYILRFKYLPLKFDNYFGYNQAHLRVFFSEWGLNWNSGDRIEMINLNLQETPNTIGMGYWKRYERSFNIPLVISWPNPITFDLSNLILYVEEGGFLIDDVEIIKKCRGDKLIQNKQYDSYFFNASSGTLIERSSNYIKAGNDVGSDSYPIGDVVIESGTRIVYKAETSIELFNGFEANDDFETILINDCNFDKLRKDSIIFYLGQKESLNKEIAWRINPNPTRFNCNLISDGIDFNAGYSFYLFNTKGERVRFGKVLNENTIIDLQELPDGIYILQITNGINSSHLKVVLVHD